MPPGTDHVNAKRNVIMKYNILRTDWKIYYDHKPGQPQAD